MYLKRRLLGLQSMFYLSSILSRSWLVIFLKFRFQQGVWPLPLTLGSEFLWMSFRIIKVYNHIEFGSSSCILSIISKFRKRRILFWIIQNPKKGPSDLLFISIRPVSTLQVHVHKVVASWHLRFFRFREQTRFYSGDHCRWSNDPIMMILSDLKGPMETIFCTIDGGSMCNTDRIKSNQFCEENEFRNLCMILIII